MLFFNLVFLEAWVLHYAASSIRFLHKTKLSLDTFLKGIIALLIVLFISGFSHATELKIGLIPEQNVFKQMARYEPLGKYIKEKTGIAIQFTILSRYGNIINSFSKNKLDGAFWGSFTGAMAVKQLNIQPIARPVNLDGTSTYHGYILTHKSSNIKNVADMKGKTIAFVEKATTAGYIFPVSYFKKHGINNLNAYFKEIYFTGSHDAAIHAVFNGEADIACAKNTIFEMLARDNPQLKDDLVIIARSPDVPSNGLGLRKELAYGVKAELQRALLTMHTDQEGQKVLKKFGVIKFIETTEKDYAPVIKLSESAGISISDYEYLNK
jgi:phosphonate transport system substrate-binding protein